MPAAALLSRLERVRQTGPGRWVECCPAHDSESKSSLTISELPDGRVLVHDFGGCAVKDVIGAVGMDFADLFPERIDTAAEAKGDRRYRSRESRPWASPDVLAAVADEALFAAIAASEMAEGISLTDERRERLWTAAGRLAAAAGWADGR